VNAKKKNARTRGRRDDRCKGQKRGKRYINKRRKERWNGGNYVVMLAGPCSQNGLYLEGKKKDGRTEIKKVGR
jgi:hypothetical protein